MILKVQVYPAMAQVLGVSEFCLEFEGIVVSWSEAQSALCDELRRMGGSSFCRGDKLAGPIVALVNGQPARQGMHPLRDGDTVRLLYVVSGG